MSYNKTREVELTLPIRAGPMIEFTLSTACGIAK
jgi:hypothetical protein